MWQSIREFIGPYLQDLPALMPYVLVGIGLLVLFILARVLVLLWARKRVSSPQETGGDEGSSGEGGGGTAPAGLSRAFSEAMGRLRRLMSRRGYHVSWFVRLTGHRYRYEVPWYAVLGEESSGKSTLLEALDLETPVEPVLGQDATWGDGAGCNWWYFNKAVVLDVAGRFVHRPSGRKTQDQGWTKTLKQLRKYRPRQPLNGVVLTIDCHDLVGESKLKPSEIEDKAARLHSKLQQMQKQLGLRLPVYVVLTKGDAIPGFSAFCEALSPERKEHMLGWSNPHSVDAAYTSDWVDECFATLERDLHYAQIRALGDGFESSRRTIQPEDVDEFFLFPRQLRSLKENLQLYLDEIFQQSAYQGAHFFRGVYVSGDPEAESGESASGSEALPAGSTAADGRWQPAFIQDLFSEKIFREWKLVRPLESAVSWQQWATRAVQGTVATLAVLGIFGLWYAGDELEERRDSILPSLREARASIQQVEDWRTRAESDTVDGPMQQDLGGQLAFESVNSSLIRNMQQTSQIDLTFFLIPASWFSDLEETLDQSVSSRYGKVILRSMRYGLQLRGERLSTGGLRRGGSRPPGADSLSVRSLPSYRSWRRYTENVRGFEANAVRYNRLPQTRNLSDFAGIAEYLFDESILQDLQSNEEAYRRAIEQADPEPLQLQQYGEPISDRVLEHARRFSRQLPQNYGLLVELRELAEELNNLNTLPARIARGQDAVQAVRSIDRSMEQIQTALAGPEGRWLRSDSLALQTVYGPYLAHADTSTLLRADVERVLISEGQAAVAELRNRLFSVQTQLGPLLAGRETSSPVGWHPEIKKLRGAIGSLLDQAYMRSPGNTNRFRADIPLGRRMVWRPAVMRQVVSQVVQKYDSLVTQGLRGYAPPVQSAARSVATAGMNEHLMEYVAQAQSYELSANAPEPRETEVRRRVNRFQETLEPLNQVLAVQEQLGMNAARSRILKATGTHAHRLLQDVDALLKRDGLYSIAEPAFEQWRGDRPPNLALTNTPDVGGVQSYLDAQQRRMQVLTNLASPLLSFLTRWQEQLSTAYRPLIDKWSNIRTELRKHQNQTAGNTLSVFEDYLTNQIEDVEPVLYFLETPESVVGRESSDFFLQRRNEVREQLYERSRELSVRQARSQYRQIASAFRNQLAGQFPFASPSGESYQQDASPAAVRRFYQQFDRYASKYLPVLERVETPESILRFLGQLESVRPAFASYLDDRSNYPVPTVEVAPEFHVNKAHSRGADQIIGWELSVGRQTARAIGSGDSLRWASGDVVRLRFRWAEDAPDRLVSAGQGSVDTGRQQVTYRYAGQWALLRLLRAHAGQASDFDGRFDPDPHTLRFAATIEGKRSGEAREALVFTRLHLYYPDRTDRIVLEEPFPKRAPAMEITASPGSSSAQAQGDHR